MQRCIHFYQKLFNQRSIEKSGSNNIVSFRYGHGSTKRESIFH